MKFYFKISEAAEREVAIMAGKKPEPITLYRETPQIAWSAEHIIHSDWWGVYRVCTPSTEWADFSSEEEAYENYYATEGIEIYEKMHDL